MKKKIAAIIQARMGSSRLPKKAMKKVLGKPLLYYMISQIKKSKTVNDIIIATSIKKENNEIRNFCKKNKIKCFSGSEKNVLSRYYKTAREYKSDVIVRLTSDCPLIDPKIIDTCVKKFLRSNYKFVANTSPPEKLTFPDGMDVEVFSFKTLKYANANCKLKSDLEHVTPFIWRNKKKFKQYKINLKKNLSHLRLTVDYREDFLLIKKIITYFQAKKLQLSLNNMVDYLFSNKDLININAFRNKNIDK